MLSLPAAGLVSHALIEFVFFSGDAIDLLVPARRLRAIEAKEFRIADPWARVHFRIGDRHRQFQSVGIDAAISLLQLHVLAVRISELVEPRPIVESDAVDDKHVAFPFADGSAIPCGLHFVRRRKLPIDEDLAPVVMPFEELNHPAGHLHDLHRLMRRDDFGVQKPGNTERIARPHRIVADRRRNGARAIARLIVFELRLAGGSERSLGCSRCFPCPENTLLNV